jgi:hypothetical protein
MVIFCTPGRVDVEPPSVADSFRECAAASPRAWQAVVDANVVDEVVEIFFLSCPSSSTSSRNSLIVSAKLLGVTCGLHVKQLVYTFLFPFSLSMQETNRVDSFLVRICIIICNFHGPSCFVLTPICRP